MAAPVGAKILEEIFAMDAGKEVKLTSLSPAIGNFKHITSIDFKNASPSSFGTDTDNGDSPMDASPQNNVSKNSAATPDINEEADAQGHVKNKSRGQDGIQKLFNFLGGGRSAASQKRE